MPVNFLNVAWKLRFVLPVFGCISLIACKEYPRNKTYAAIPESSVRAGERLAAVHCRSCHELPDPSLLDVKSWEDGVLPQMGPRLGIFKHNFRYYPSAKKDPFLDSGYYPSKPLITPAQWQSIMNYYLATSPDTLPQQARNKIAHKSLPFFKVEMPPFQYDSSAVSFIHINQSASGPELLFNDIRKQQLFRLNKNLVLSDSIVRTGNIVDMEFHNGKTVICDIGQLNPTNGKFGSLAIGLNNSSRRFDTVFQTIARHLARPVDIASGDLNKDGTTDYVVCEFGNLTGSLSWLQNVRDNKFERHELSALPGAIKAYLHDYNNDGLSDLWVLFAQGREGVVVFTNLGNGKFRQQEVLSFPAVYGSSFFELADFNHDGAMDIVYTCGDNADFSMILKPYHGVYIFLNDGNNKFRQQYFFPLNGCFKAIPRDYDQDGDLDIAAIGFFPDFVNQPEEGFVYLENKGNFNFESYSFPEAQLGRWLTMDAGDIDGDGRIDLVLGNFSIRPSAVNAAHDWKKGPPFILLKNLKR
ncbi:MAG TPA: VCBS repeat-containing protein [Flavitalea sp.]|nr:VCBS repeat-containing protein [Flavitalea sp.]